MAAEAGRAPLGPAAAGAALVGPNAVLQTAQALRAHGGEALAARIFAEAGLPALLAAPPEGMVPERVAADLHRALAASLPEAEAQAVALLERAPVRWDAAAAVFLRRAMRRALA
ncbi:MAG: hypothetical protein AAFV49_14960, partial [Pseudomonadota bacterium]